MLFFKKLNSDKQYFKDIYCERKKTEEEQFSESLTLGPSLGFFFFCWFDLLFYKIMSE